MLQELLAHGGTTVQDIAADEDFAGLHVQPWFAALAADPGSQGMDTQG